MFSGILKHMESLEFGQAELDQPVSLTAEGQVATLRDWIDERAPQSVRAAFGRSDAQAAHPHVKSASSLSAAELTHLAAEFVRSSPPNEALAIVGQGNFTRDELIQQIESQTEVGERLIRAVRQYVLFMEQAIESGKIKPIEREESVALPEFEF